MKPVDQTKLYGEGGIHNGNCLAACLASLLEIELWMVPPFEDMFGRGYGQWKFRMAEWLERFFGSELVRIEGHEVCKIPTEFYIANGLSSRGVAHSVIFRNGELAHDPHWMKDGINTVEWTWHLSPVGKTDSVEGAAR